MEAAKYRQQSEIDQLSKEIDSLKEEVERKTSNISQIERQAKVWDIFSWAVLLKKCTVFKT